MTGVSLGQLLLALDATLVELVEAPRGLDLPVASAALLDSDDVRLGLALAAGSADVFFLLGISEEEAVRWIDRQAATRRPAAIFVKEPGPALVQRAAALGVAVVAVEPRARWERLYRLVNHVFEHHGDRGDPRYDSDTDLFALAQSIADRTRGMVSIEDAQSHVLAYSASNDEADELRRLSILGRAGPPEHLAWLAQWGIFDALRAGTDVVRVDARPEFGLRPRRAIGIHRSDVDERRAPTFAGTIWLQEGSRPLADDTDEVLRGAAVLAARIMARLAATPSRHTLRVHQLLGLHEGPKDDTMSARALGLAVDGRAEVVGVHSATPHARLADILGLSASAFQRDALVAGLGQRVYIVFPEPTRSAAVTSWLRGVVSTLEADLGLVLRAVTAGTVTGLAQIAAARVDVDRALDSADRHPGAFDRVSSLAEARTTVLLDEIVAWLAEHPRLVDSRVQQLDPTSATTLRTYLDSFGDVAAAAAALHVHPNTVRYRMRRIEQMLGTPLNDPEVRLLLDLSLRAVG
jgi:DNA-binding PucR family transcriptional regulator